MLAMVSNLAAPNLKGAYSLIPTLLPEAFYYFRKKGSETVARIALGLLPSGEGGKSFSSFHFPPLHYGLPGQHVKGPS